MSLRESGDLHVAGTLTAANWVIPTESLPTAYTNFTVYDTLTFNGLTGVPEILLPDNCADALSIVGTTAI